MMHIFARFSGLVSRALGNPIAFLIACLAIIAWAAMGPVLGFSDTWQLFINTGTTIATFLMVFVLQNTQNRDAVAVQAKLDELIRVTEARNELMRVEELSEEEVEDIRKKACDGD